MIIIFVTDLSSVKPEDTLFKMIYRETEKSSKFSQKEEKVKAMMLIFT